MKTNRSRYAILGMVSLRPMTGYEIRQTIERGIGNFWRESFGQIYPLLAALTAEGLVAASADPGGRRGSKRYAITPAGRRELRAWLDQPIAVQVGRNELLLKLFLGVASGPRNARAHVAQFRRAHEALRERYAAIGRWLRDEHRDSPHLPYWLLTLRYGELETAALLAWCDHAEAQLKRTSKKGKRS
jgi:DNA-binding PadR family transcriptional regulator